VEVLVSPTLELGVVAMLGVFFVASRNRVQEQVLRVETLQGLRAAMDSMVRDLRLGGACLPTTGEFITLGGVDGTTDQIVTRSGIVRPNQSCIRTVPRQDAARALRNCLSKPQPALRRTCVRICASAITRREALSP
jgi:hypothetical protein